MFIQIEIREATDILIAIPTDNAAVTAQSILDMFEGNAVFLKQGWNETSEVVPKGTIHLGNEFTCANNRNPEEKYVVAASDKIPLGFQRFDVSLFVDYKDATKKAADTIRSKEEEIKALKETIERQKESIIKLANSDEEVD